MKQKKHLNANGTHMKFEPIAELKCQLRGQPNACGGGSVKNLKN